MATTYGMSETLGLLMLSQGKSIGFLGGSGEKHAYSERVAEAIDAEIRGLLYAGMRQAEQILLRHQDVLKALAARLLEDETIEGDDLEQIFQGARPAEGTAVTHLAGQRHRPGATNLPPLPRISQVGMRLPSAE